MSVALGNPPARLVTGVRIPTRCEQPGIAATKIQGRRRGP
jgi:hypothetical protein